MITFFDHINSFQNTQDIRIVFMKQENNKFATEVRWKGETIEFKQQLKIE